MRILIVKIGAIGDVVMSLPLLSSLRREYPSATITWVCGKRVSPLLKATKMVDRLIEIDESKLLKGSFLTKLRALFFIWKQIGGRRYELSLRLHPDIRYKAINWPIRCKDRRSWGKNGSHFLPTPGRYHALEYLALQRPQKNWSMEDVQFPELELPNCSFKADVLIAPGGAKNPLTDDALRRWPITYYADLIRLLQQHSLKVAVIGGQEDTWVLPHLQGLHFENWIKKFDLLELISCMKNSRLLITHDSGPLHLAKIVRCPALALFGPTNPHEKISPRENIQVFWGGKDLCCRPCYNGKTFARCSSNACLSSILPETIYRNALQQLHLYTQTTSKI